MYKVKLDVEMIKGLDEEEVVDECYIAYLTLLPQIKKAGKLTKEVILSNAELLEDSFDCFYDEVSIDIARIIRWIPVDLLPNEVEVGSSSASFTYDDFTINFDVEEDCRYFLVFSEAWNKHGLEIDYDSELKGELEQIGDIANVITQVKEYFESRDSN